jgi:hypothetical protein
MTYQPKIMVDSGAYSAWKLGKEVDLDRYCDYIAANLDWIAHYINLDIIMPEDPERSARESLEALLKMRSRSLDPIAVFHAKEDVSWLHRTLDLGCRYIALAPRALPSAQAIDEWYSVIWPHLVDSGGQPLVRVHALGEAREHALCRYPWASADSTAWLDSMRYGKVRLGDGQGLMHGKSRTKTSRAAPDVDTLRGQDLAILGAKLAKAGLRPDALEPREGSQPILVRGYLAALEGLAMEARIRRAHDLRLPVMRSLFSVEPATRRALTAREPFHLYLGLPSNAYTLPIIRRAGVEHGLVSYFYIPDAHLDKDVKFRGVIRTKHLKSFVQDPDATVTKAPFTRSTKIFGEILDHAAT